MNSKAPCGPMSPSSRSRKVAWRRTRMSNGSLSTFPRYVFFSQTVLVFSRDTKAISLFRVRISSQATSRSTLLVLCPLWLLAMTLSQTPLWVVILVQTTFPSMQKAPTPLGAWIDGQIVNVTVRKGNLCWLTLLSMFSKSAVAEIVKIAPQKPKSKGVSSGGSIIEEVCLEISFLSRLKRSYHWHCFKDSQRCHWP